MVETQLLPSLRDTIDRMTRPPSRPSSSLKVRQPQADRSPSPALSMDYSRPRTPMTPKPVTPQHPAEEPTTPKSKPPPKSALKSALRAPTPKLFAPSPEPPHPPSGGSALRSVRSLLRRKSSASSTNAPKPVAKVRQFTRLYPKN